MKLKLNTNNFTNPNYQHVSMYDAKNVVKPKNILDLKLIDEETNRNFTLGELIEEKDTEIKKLRKDLNELKEDLTNKTNRLLDIIEALKQETRDKGVI